jgi:hypothetical protein
MIANAALVASILYLALLFFVMGQLRFLAPWRRLILQEYWPAIAIYSAQLIVNLFGLVIFVQRKVFLKDAGRKLVHFDKQIHSGEHGLSYEIAAHFETHEED